MTLDLPGPPPRAPSPSRITVIDRRRRRAEAQGATARAKGDQIFGMRSRSGPSPPGRSPRARKRQGTAGHPSPEDIENLIACAACAAARSVPGARSVPADSAAVRSDTARVARSRPRPARRGDVRLALLRLLAEEPRNGYQLMQTIEERSGGRWRPSPGSVYPTLAQLEDEGLVRSSRVRGRDGSSRSPTPAASTWSAPSEPAPWEPPRRTRTAHRARAARDRRSARRPCRWRRPATRVSGRGRSRCSPRPGAASTGCWPRNRRMPVDAREPRTV